jgi:hypothetical protein
MERPYRSFNLYFVLCAVAAAAVWTGCTSLNMSEKAASPDNEMATIRFYLEGQKADTFSSASVLVTSNKFRYTIEKDPFLDEGDLTKASLINGPDGTFSIQLQFNEHGMLLLDMYTAGNKSKHIIVYSQFPLKGVKPLKEKKKKQNDPDDSDVTERAPGPQYPPGTPRQAGWLAAVLIRDRISNGSFRFTPDASHAEAVRIVRGLKKVIVENNGKKEKEN